MFIHSEPIWSTIVNDVALFPYRINIKTRSLTFARMSQDKYRDEPFLDERAIGPEQEQFDVSIADVFRMKNILPLLHTRPHFIFHTAFCGSTLLARCLDVPGRSLVYKEPYIMAQLSAMLASARQNSSSSDQRIQELAAIVLALLSRTLDSTEISIIKMPDVANESMTPIMALANKGSQALFLYNDLETFLVATLKNQTRRSWIESRTSWLKRCLSPYPDLNTLDVATLNLGQRAGLIWLWQQLIYLNFCQQANPERIRAVPMSSFFAQPQTILAAIVAFLNLPLSKLDTETIIQSHILEKHAKEKVKNQEEQTANYRPYNRYTRMAEMVAMQASLQEEIEEIQGWLSPLIAEWLIPTRLPQGLLLDI